MKNLRSGHPLAALALAVAMGLSGCGGQNDEKLLESARGYVEAKDYSAAMIQLRVILQKTPESPMGRYLLGRSLLATGQPVAAAVELRKALELAAPAEQVAPELARAMLASGEQSKLLQQFGDMRLKSADTQADLDTTLAAAYAIQGHKEKAYELSNRALQAKPGYSSALILQARLKASDGDNAAATQLLDKVLAQEPGNERAGVLLAELKWHFGRDAAGAVESLRKVLAAQPSSVPARVALIGVLTASDRKDESRTELAELIKVAPKHPDAIFLQSQAAFQDGKLDVARGMAETLLKVAPESVKVLSLAGAIELRARNFAPAITYLSKAVANDPSNVMCRQLLAQTYLRMGRAAKAAETLDPVVDSKSADGVSLALAAEANLQDGNGARADELFKRAAQASPNDPKVRTAVALAQFSKGDTNSAMAALEAIAVDDKSPRADMALVSARLRANDATGAMKAIDAMQLKMPDQPLPQLLRGRLLLATRDVAGARTAFEAALAKDQNYFPAISGLASLDLATGRADLSRKRLEDYLLRDATNFHAHMALAELAARTGSPPAEVTKFLQAAVKAGPTQPEPRLALVEQFLRVGDLKSALTSAQEAVAALPSNVDALNSLGVAQLASGNSQQAVSTFSKVTAASPKSAGALVRLADAHMLGKDVASARRVLLKASELDPTSVAVNRALAAVALQQGKPDEARDIARKLQKLRPKQPDGFVLEGDLERQRRSWQGALTAYKAAFDLNPVTDLAIRVHQAQREAGLRPEADRFAADWQKQHAADVGFRYYLGDVAMAAGDFAGAEKHYRAVLETQPRNALALNNVAWLLVKQGKPGAVPMAEEANSLMPNRAPMLDTLAGALAAENNIKRAIEVQQQAVSLNREDQNLRLQLARLFVKAGEKAQARAELEDLARLGDKFQAHREVADLLQTLR